MKVIIVGDRVLGGLTFGFIATRIFDTEECKFFLPIAQHCTLRMQYPRERMRKSSLIGVYSRLCIQ
jgi:hypothetical protein